MCIPCLVPSVNQAVNPLDRVCPIFLQETDENARVNLREGHLAYQVVIEAGSSEVQPDCTLSRSGSALGLRSPCHWLRPTATIWNH